MENPLRRIGGILVLVLALIALLSCYKNEEIHLDPPAMPPLSREEIGYGVVTAPYTHVVDKPDSQGLSLGYLRRGSVVRVLERRNGGTAGGPSTVTVPESWVLVEARGGAMPDSRGWLQEPVIELYPTRAQALTASEFLVQ
jgi:hypothetical protein